MEEERLHVAVYKRTPFFLPRCRFHERLVTIGVVESSSVPGNFTNLQVKEIDCVLRCSSSSCDHDVTNLRGIYVGVVCERVIPAKAVMSMQLVYILAPSSVCL